MKALLALLFVGVAGWFVYQMIGASGGPDLKFEGDEVLLATGDLDVRFSKGKTFEDTYMVFGGLHLEHRNAVANISLAGLSMRHAKPIHRRFPDFDRCASPGASLAKDKVTSLDMVPADGETLKVLASTLKEFEKNIQEGGDRVCVQLSGTKLNLTSAEIREVGENVTETMKMSDFYLVDSASRVECKEALGGA
jgi:hypothetical protein